VSRIERFFYVDVSEANKGAHVMRYGEPGQIVLCPAGSVNAIGTLAESAKPSTEVAVELFESSAAVEESTRTTRVERNELALYLGDERIAPNRDDDLQSSYVQQEMFRTLLAIVRFLGPKLSIRLPDGRELLSVSLPEDVGIDWIHSLRDDLDRLIDLRSAPLYHAPASWPTPPPAPVVDPNTEYIGPMSNMAFVS